eukprot:UN12520
MSITYWSYYWLLLLVLMVITGHTPYSWFFYHIIFFANSSFLHSKSFRLRAHSGWYSIILIHIILFYVSAMCIYLNINGSAWILPWSWLSSMTDAVLSIIICHLIFNECNPSKMTHLIPSFITHYFTFAFSGNFQTFKIDGSTGKDSPLLGYWQNEIKC